MKNIILFENERVDNLYPFSITHCSWEVRCGALRLYEKINYLFPNSTIQYYARNKWLKSFLKRNNLTNREISYDDSLFISGNVILNDSSIKLLNKLAENKDQFVITSNSVPIGFYTKLEINQLSEYISKNDQIDLNNDLFEDFEKIEIDGLNIIEYIWDALFINGEQINSDSQYILNLHSIFSSSFHGASLTKPTNILIGKNVKISPSVVIDASDGKVLIGDNVNIMPQSTIIGPCFIGNNSTIKIGAKIYPDNSIGEWCKIGGELENSIIHAYSNKQHEGFLGHSYIGEWVNLGADTNNSDLKNTYSQINMVLPHSDINTGRIFLGLMCGDHTKSGINSMFTTGTTAGVCGILVKEWFLPNFINSFTWGGKSNSPTYKFDKAIETARIVMERRNKLLLDEEIELLRIEYDRVTKNL